MPSANWRIKGPEFAACNCAWGCPCQFNALPTHGHCHGMLAMRIDEGFFEDARLDGLLWGMCCEWPGAIHEGNGRMLVFVESRATEAQRRAMVEIVHGRHSAEGTLFNIFSAVCPTKVDPMFVPIEFALDMDGRRASVRAPGVIEVDVEPIRNPVTGDPHFPRISLPNGFEFKEAEVASATIRATGPIQYATKDSHAHLAVVQHGPQGYIA